MNLLFGVSVGIFAGTFANLLMRGVTESSALWLFAATIHLFSSMEASARVLANKRRRAPTGITAWFSTLSHTIDLTSFIAFAGVVPAVIVAASFVGGVDTLLRVVAVIMGTSVVVEAPRNRLARSLTLPALLTTVPAIIWGASWVFGPWAVGLLADYPDFDGPPAAKLWGLVWRLVVAAAVAFSPPYITPAGWAISMTAVAACWAIANIEGPRSEEPYEENYAL